MIDFARARQTMVDNQVATSSVTDRQLLSAMRRIPRENYVPATLADLAYIDREVPLTSGRVLPAPAPFARLAQLAGITPGDKVLDAGCATGYSAAVLAALADRIVALETDAGLARQAKANLEAGGIANVTIVSGQLQAAAEAPFDVVVVEEPVAAPPPQLLGLLRDGGRLVALIHKENAPPVAHLFVKQGSTISGHATFDVLQRGNARQNDDAFVF